MTDVADYPPYQPATPKSVCRHCKQPIVRDDLGGWTHVDLTDGGGMLMGAQCNLWAQPEGQC